MEFAGRTAIVTGAGSGMGLLTAQCLARQGASVVLTDARPEAVEEAAQALRTEGLEAVARKVDVRVYEEVKAAIDFAIERYGHVDIVVNSAGGASYRVLGHTGTFQDWPVECLDWGIDVNLKGPLYFAHAVIKHMIERKAGVILNIGSIDGQTGSGAVDYSTAKSGVMFGLTKSLALYGAPHGVRCCCVSPGPVLTRPAMAKMRTPMGRAAEPQEVVDLILYLCSDKAAFITGANHLIDGGRACGAKD